MTPAHNSQIDMNQVSAYSSKPLAHSLSKSDELHARERNIEMHFELAASEIKVIKERELWRAEDYSSWSDYCRRRWCKSRADMFRLLEDAQVVLDVKEQIEEEKNTILLTNSEKVLEISNALPPANQAQAHALRRVPRKNRLQVLRAVQESGNVTAKAIFTAAELLENGESASEYQQPCDLTGFPIPDSLTKRWNQRQEVQEKITAASRLRCALEDISNKGHQDPIYGTYDWQGMIRTIGQLQFHLGQCKPEVVCYNCDGDYLALKSSKGGDGIDRHCHVCNDRGFLPKKQWEGYAESKLEVVQKRVQARLAKCRKVEE